MGTRSGCPSSPLASAVHTPTVRPWEQQRLIPLVVGRCWPVPDRAARTDLGHGQHLDAGSKERLLKAHSPMTTCRVMGASPPLRRTVGVSPRKRGSRAQASACSAVGLYRAPTGTSCSGGNAVLRRKAPPHGLPVGSSRWRGFSGFLRMVRRGVASRSCSAFLFLMFVGLGCCTLLWATDWAF
jgi:hypothetical protein